MPTTTSVWSATTPADAANAFGLPSDSALNSPTRRTRPGTIHPNERLLTAIDVTNPDSGPSLANEAASTTRNENAAEPTHMSAESSTRPSTARTCPVERPGRAGDAKVFGRCPNGGASAGGVSDDGAAIGGGMCGVACAQFEGWNGGGPGHGLGASVALAPEGGTGDGGRPWKSMAKTSAGIESRLRVATDPDSADRSGAVRPIRTVWGSPSTIGRVTPSQLTAFAAIVRHGSAKRAAEELGVSEAAISSHTAALRKELNDPLYRRSASGLAFTPGGLRLATRAAELLGLQDQTRLEVEAASRGQRILRLATTALFAEYAAPGLIELFKTRADDLHVEMSVHGSDGFVELLTSRQADVAIGPAASKPIGELRAKEFLRYQLILVVAAGHPLAAGRANKAKLAAQPWLLGPAAAEPNGATQQLLKRFGVPEENQRIFQSHAAALAETTDGNGIGVVPEFRVREALGQRKLHRLSAPGADASATWQATTLALAQTPPVAAELARFVSTPRAIQAMLTGSGANIGHFRPRVHVTLWS